MKRDVKESKRTLHEIYDKINEMYRALGISDLKKRADELEKQTHDENFWTNAQRASLVNREISKIRKKIAPWEELRSQVSEDIELFELAEKEQDEGVLEEIDKKIDSYLSKYELLETMELLSDESDSRNAFLSIHPGAGGTESQDWASMLFRMYLRWAEEHGYKVDIIDYTPGEEAGIKSATILVSGENAYGLLKAERGIHRLVRISPFDANKRRHTSFAAVDVVPEIDDDIEVEINDSDLRIDTYRSSGAGGQHVNTTDSAVRITHLPTGIVVQCQNERSQHKNKAFAMKVLRAKLYELKKKELEEKTSEKIGEKKEISWGNQIRSYVFQPYTLVKDHRTGTEIGAVDRVLDGEIDPFIYAYLKNIKQFAS
ncbi:MAG: peptide chain release factor 2 [Spirochaetes bacterium]|nr:peptide chain release factor 2 [Spirochaetota bacterium]